METQIEITRNHTWKQHSLASWSSFLRENPHLPKPHREKECFQGASAINGETEGSQAPQPTCHCVASANPNMVFVLPGSLVSQQDHFKKKKRPRFPGVVFFPRCRLSTLYTYCKSISIRKCAMCTLYLSNWAKTSKTSSCCNENWMMLWANMIFHKHASARLCLAQLLHDKFVAVATFPVMFCTVYLKATRQMAFANARKRTCIYIYILLRSAYAPT